MSLADYDPVAPEAWRLRAACRGKPTDWWFPEQGQPSFVDGQPSARAICERCPVQPECLHYSTVDHYEKWGVWAGLNESERRRIRSRRRRTSNVVPLFTDE